MPSAKCRGCGEITNSAISNYWQPTEPDNKTPKEMGVATVCYAAFDVPNNRWMKGCFYDKLDPKSTKRSCVDGLIQKDEKHGK